MKKLMLVALALIACSCGTGSTSSSSSSSSSSSTSGGASCDDVMAGTWTMGSTAATDCFGMSMTLHAEFTACTVTFTQPSMSGDRPNSATVSGSAVTFHGGTGNSWEGCAATLTDNMHMANGACSGSMPCTFSMHM